MYSTKFVALPFMKENLIPTLFLQSTVFMPAAPDRPQMSAPRPTGGITNFRDLVIGLARAGKGYTEIQKTVNIEHVQQFLEKAAIYKIMKEIKGRLRQLRPAALGPQVDQGHRLSHRRRNRRRDAGWPYDHQRFCCSHWGL